MPDSTAPQDAMKTYCRFLSGTRYGDLPANVVDYARKSILDTMACIVGGSGLEGIPAVVGMVKAKGGRPQSLIPFYGSKVPATEAALAIGPMARAMDLGDVHDRGAGHASEYVLPTLLAACGLKERVSGKDFITAFVLGNELLIRVGMAYNFVSKAIPAGRGAGHSIFGAVAGTAKLLGFTLEEMEHAEAIAGYMTQSHSMASRQPALISRVHHGLLSADAVLACLLVREGITGPRDNVLEGPEGFLGFAKWDTDPGAVTRGLGEVWEMTTTRMKPYAACMATHTAIYGLLEQMGKHDFAAGDIERIELDETALNMGMAGFPLEAKWNPRSTPECQFSIPYVVATAAFEKDVFLDAYTPEARARRDVRELMTRITAKVDESVPPPHGARVTTTLKNGRRHSGEYVRVKGHPENPLTAAELVGKFRKCVPYCACPLSDAVVERVTGALLELENVEDVVEAVLRPLTPKA